MTSATMTSTLRERRMEAEWRKLQQLAAANPLMLRRIARNADSFCFMLAETPGWVEEDTVRHVVTDHAICYRFPRYFPTLPMEAYCEPAPFHPNADPRSGFLCLWLDNRPRHSVLDAVVITRSILAHHSVNRDAPHCMQPQALHCEPLPLSSIAIPESLSPEPPRQRRHSPRLTPVQDDTPELERTFAIPDTQ